VQVSILKINGLCFRLLENVVTYFNGADKLKNLLSTFLSACVVDREIYLSE
jgi:hypothetical protein